MTDADYQQAFRAGAAAMQGRIASVLIGKDRADAAREVLRLALPAAERRASDRPATSKAGAHRAWS